MSASWLSEPSLRPLRAPDLAVLLVLALGLAATGAAAAPSRGAVVDSGTQVSRIRVSGGEIEINGQTVRDTTGVDDRRRSDRHDRAARRRERLRARVAIDTDRIEVGDSGRGIVRRGRSTVKTQPVCGLFLTLKIPSLASTLRRQIERPKPRPDLSSPI